MPLKKQQSDGEIPADREFTDREATLEAKRIRKRASLSLLRSHTPPQTAQIPTALRKSDGADIIKRNAGRKKKYIFIFPGALSLPVSGGKIGSLTALNTRNPILNIEFPSGTLRLLGTLVFPQNAFLSVKPAKRAVQVIDVFETMIVFSEWRWLGDLASNPGGIPVPLPDTMRACEEDLWRSASLDVKPSGEGTDDVRLSSGGESSVLMESDEDGWAAATTDRVAPLRSNPRRKGRVVNYSQLENDQSGENSAERGNGEADNDRERGVKRRTNLPQDKDDSVQIVEDSDVEEVKPRRASRGKRRKLDYSGEFGDEIEPNESFNRKEYSSNSRSQDGPTILQRDESVELVESGKDEEEEIETRHRSRTTRRRIKYSQESGDEDIAELDDEEDKDFAVDAGSDVLTLD